MLPAGQLDVWHTLIWCVLRFGIFYGFLMDGAYRGARHSLTHGTRIGRSGELDARCYALKERQDRLNSQRPVVRLHLHGLSTNPGHSAKLRSVDY